MNGRFHVWIRADQSDLTGRLTTGFLNQPSNELCLIFGAIGNVKIGIVKFQVRIRPIRYSPARDWMHWCCRALLRNHSVNIHSLLIKNFQECRARVQTVAVNQNHTLDSAWFYGRRSNRPRLFCGRTLHLQCIQLLLSGLLPRDEDIPDFTFLPTTQPLRNFVPHP